ncbi:ferredoxin [Rhodococcus sp. NPDC058521]|uniref:ferredoxin n=1 Tax=Rhodococcus sp. NPDC058521 TaxID=3346536 RepID=UPI003663131C
MTYVITEACIDLMDRACVRECPMDCIYEGEHQLFVNPSECIDCGACEPACPHEAVYHEAELPDDQAHTAERQNAVFLTLGKLGGARKYGKLPVPDA